MMYSGKSGLPLVLVWSLHVEQLSLQEHLEGWVTSNSPFHIRETKGVGGIKMHSNPSKRRPVKIHTGTFIYFTHTHTHT